MLKCPTIHFKFPPKKKKFTNKLNFPSRISHVAMSSIPVLVVELSRLKETRSKKLYYVWKYESIFTIDMVLGSFNFKFKMCAFSEREQQPNRTRSERWKTRDDVVEESSGRRTRYERNNSMWCAWLLISFSCCLLVSLSVCYFWNIIITTTRRGQAGGVLALNRAFRRAQKKKKDSAWYGQKNIIKRAGISPFGLSVSCGIQQRELEGVSFSINSI